MSIIGYAKKHSVIVTVAILFALIVVVLVSRVLRPRSEANLDNGVKKVSLVNVSTFRNGNITVTANGTVESFSQADLKSQMSAPVSVVLMNIGDPVSQGQVILELSNADIRAQLAQAQASLSVAEGQQLTSGVSLESTKQGVIDKLNDAYSKAYDVVYAQIDPILYNNDGNGGRLQSYVTDAEIFGEITDLSVGLRSRLDEMKRMTRSLSLNSKEGDFVSAIAYSQEILTSADILLQDMSETTNDLARFSSSELLGQINSWKTVISLARSTVNSQMQILTGAKTALTTGITSQNTSISASVVAARAGVDNLNAQLSKTIIRSPIGGKIASLPLRVGELATPGTLLATVVGDTDRLKIKAFVSGADLSKLEIGAAVIIGASGPGANNATGTISNISPSVDPNTKKAEINVDIADSRGSGLVVGQNVALSIKIGLRDDTKTDRPVIYLLPIQNVKIVPGSAFVYTVDQDSKIKSNEVMLGKVQGDFIEVISGLNDEMNIVSPVYELDLGQTVSVQ